MASASRRTPHQSSRKHMRRLLNYLIEDYLRASDYQYSLSVFQPESGCGSQQLDYESIRQYLKLEPGSELYGILQKKGFGPGPGAALSVPVWPSNRFEAAGVVSQPSLTAFLLY